MAKIKSSTKVSAAAAKSRRRAGAKKPAAAGSGNPAVAAGRPAETKQARFVRMLQRDGGASVAELAAAMGWLTHTTRAALTRLRQSGHELAVAHRRSVEQQLLPTSSRSRQRS